MINYPDSWEFINHIEVEEDFHIMISVLNMHVWLIANRLRDFTKNQFSYSLSEKLIEQFEEKITAEINSLEVLRKGRKIDDIKNYLLTIREQFDYHFNINNVSVVNPYFKIDALVWQNIYH